MKTILYTFGLILTLVTQTIEAQDRTTVRANNIDISDNLDLRAVANIFGESRDLEDFEQRLNDPNIQISNLDLNQDNQVDYLRVIESVEGYTHLIIIQAVLGRDLFQDVATIEVEKDNRNRTVQVQVVGDVFLYGANYIYEPVYYHTPVIYTRFWIPNYVVYYSPWYWSFYPRYYWAWSPYPIYRYRTNVNMYINVNNSCHYVTHRRSHRAVAMHATRRANSYEKQYPDRSFSARNQNVNNRYELTQNRENRNSNRDLAVVSARGKNANVSNSVRNSGQSATPRNQASGSAVTSIRTNGTSTATPRNNSNGVLSDNGAVNNPRNTVPKTSTSGNSNPRSAGRSIITDKSSGTSVSNGTITPRSSSTRTTNIVKSQSSSNVSKPRNNSPSASFGTSNSSSVPRSSATSGSIARSGSPKATSGSVRSTSSISKNSNGISRGRGN